MGHYNKIGAIDDKILFWDRKNFDELVASFSDDEIDELIFELDHLEFHFDIGLDDWDDYPNKESKNHDIVKEYIKRWFYCDIEYGDFGKAEEMYEIVKAMG